MEYIVINATLYTLTLFFYWLRRRKIDCGFLLLSVYAGVACMGLLYYPGNENQWNLLLWPFLYLYLVLMMFFRPVFFDTDRLYQRLQVDNPRTIRLISYVFVLCAAVALYYSFQDVLVNLRSGEWGLLRLEMYEGNVALYENSIERFAKIFNQYFNSVAVVIFFWLLTLPKPDRFLLIMLGLSIVLPSFATSIIIVSRGMLIQTAFLLVTGYLIFRSGIPAKRKNWIKAAAALLFAVMLIYSLSVTQSRFGEEEQGSSLYFYFAHSMLKFNNGLADCIQSFYHGRYFFNWFYSLLGLDATIDFSTLGANIGTAFITFVGTLYVDFGPIGVFLIALFVPMFFSYRFKYSNRYDVADIFLFVFYLNYLMMGVFVVGRGNSLVWLMAFLVFGMLKLKFRSWHA